MSAPQLSPFLIFGRHLFDMQYWSDGDAHEVVVLSWQVVAQVAPLMIWHASELPHTVEIFLQLPLAGSQASVTIVPPLQAAGAQLTGVPAAQSPAAVHCSSPSHLFALAQGVPTGFGLWVQAPPGAQPSMVQGFASSQSPGVVHGLHPGMGTCFGPVTASQLSVVHGSLSSYETGSCWTPMPGAQESTVQASLSSVGSGVPGAQAPAAQRSSPLH